MIIEFRVENHRSLRDEQALTFEAAPRVGSPDDPRPRSVPGSRRPLLPVVALYGANASGKSNILSALAYMRGAVLGSVHYWKPDEGVPRSPFAWGPRKTADSMYELTHLVQDFKFAYGFVVNDKVVVEEWLHAWPNKRKQVLFTREADNYKFGSMFPSPNDKIIEVTRPNALYLSTAASFSNRIAFAVKAWWHDLSTINLFDPPHSQGKGRHLHGIGFSKDVDPYNDTIYHDNDEDLASIGRLMRLLDFGVTDIRVVPDFATDQITLHNRKVQLKHNKNDKDSWLDFDEESAGTKALLRIGPTIIDALESGGVLVADELESSLHPNLAVKIIELFNNPQTNPKNAQLIFTTHDTNLLGNTLGESPLRRDQVWFTEKDQEGATTLYPLTDYKPRKQENLERGYLQGRYGAVPFLGDISSIVEAQDGETRSKT